MMFGRLKKMAVGPYAHGPGIFQIRGVGARVSVLESGDGPVLVDTGMRGSAPFISAGLSGAGMSFPDIRLIVLTHFHPDHSGGLHGAARLADAEVAAHEHDYPFLNGDRVPPNLFTRHRLTTKITRPLVRWMYSQPVDVNHRLNDGDSLPLDDGIRVIHTPGHTTGSITLLSEEHGWLLVGDALQHRFGRLNGPASYVTQDYAAARASIEKLLQYDFDSIWFSHFPPIRGGAKQRLSRLVDSHTGS